MKGNNMSKLQRMIAIVLFFHPRDVSPGMDALTERGFDCEILHDAIDDWGPTVFCTATLVTEIDIDEFQHLVEGIVWPRGGDIYAWGDSETFGDPMAWGE
jgi:hypothetical protein